MLDDNHAQETETRDEKGCYQSLKCLHLVKKLANLLAEPMALDTLSELDGKPASEVGFWRGTPQIPRSLTRSVEQEKKKRRKDTVYR